MNSTETNTTPAPAAPTAGASVDRLIRREEVAALLSIGPSKLDDWRARGKVPPPAIVERDAKDRCRTVLWSHREIVEWIDAGCPLADDWATEQARRRAAARRAPRKAVSDAEG